AWAAHGGAATHHHTPGAVPHPHAHAKPAGATAGAGPGPAPAKPAAAGGGGDSLEDYIRKSVQK
ncbi:MAG: hypothetical protein ACRENE_12430, partial [Polyangiaceae bacterium]